MVENKPPKASQGGGRKPAADRLAEALRNNLKRRKTQARAKASEPEPTPQAKREKPSD